MSRAQPSRFPSLDHEPRAIYASQGPPPAYRNGGVQMETDTWSEYSAASSGLGKRRNSWTNLIESDENLNKHKVNAYPKVNAPFNNQALSSSHHIPFSQPVSRASSQIAHVSQVYQHHAPPAMQPVMADPSNLNQQYRVVQPLPAGTVSQMSKAPSIKAASSLAPSSPASLPQSVKPKRNRLQDCRQWIKRPLNCVCCLLIVVVFIIAIVVAAVLGTILPVPRSVSMSWLPPESLRAGQSTPTKIQLTTDQNQIRLQMQGAIPFKGNYISYYDFKSNRVVVVDESLRVNGKTLACFILPLDRSNLKDGREMRAAANKAKHRQSQLQGWGESWAWLPSPLQTPPSFEQPIRECEGARWIQLDYASTNQKSRKCSDCHDFCLPDYGIERDNLRDESYLNILKRNCFYLFVPEWRSYAQANTMEQNQRDFEQYYRNRNHLSTTYGGPNSESKWIPLSVPKTIANATNQLMGNVANTVGNAVDSARTAIFGGNNGQQNQQMHPNMGQNQQGGMVVGYGTPNQQGVPTYGVSPSGGGGADGVVGVVNLQGVNGNNGNTAYNMQNQQQPYGNPNTMNMGSSQLDSYRSYQNQQMGGGSSGQQQPPPQMNGFGANPAYNSQGQIIQGQNNPGESRPFAGYVPDVAPNPPAYPQNPNQGNSGYGMQSGTQAGFQNPYGSGNSESPMRYSIGVGEDRRSGFVDSNGVNPPGGYIPQVQQQASGNMGVVGMELPPQPAGSRSGYTPDVVSVQQQQQQQPQPNGRWVMQG